VPSSLALVTATFTGAERGAAIGSWTAWTGIAFVIGPLGGGALVEFVSWRWIFAINVPAVLLTLALVRAGVPESADAGASRRIDYVGAVLASLGLAGPVFALIEQPVYGWEDPLVFVPTGAAGRGCARIRGR
jgi:MFS family permease